MNKALQLTQERDFMVRREGVWVQRALVGN